MTRIIIVIMGQDCKRYLDMAIESVQGADKIIYIDGGSTDTSIKIAKKYDVEIIEHSYDQDDPKMNGKQRNIYLNYLKEHHLGDWCIVLDSDEILADFNILRMFIDNLEKTQNYFIVSPRIHHFVGDLGHEDATREKHYVANRIFKISNSLEYPEVEHPVLTFNPNIYKLLLLEDVHIWHLRECLGIFDTLKKHLNNSSKSNIHSKGYLDWWYKSMIFGNYPTKKVYYGDLPKIIKERFLL